MSAIGTRKLKIKIGGTEYRTEVGSAKFASAAGDSDTITFAEADAGGLRDYVLNLRLLQDMVTTSLWRKIFDTPGTDVSVTVMPYGNDVATATQPHLTTTATIQEPDGDFLGVDANASTTARGTVEVSWPCTRPVLVSA